MDDVVEPARTARAKCRGCGEKIDKGALRFGERIPNPYAEGETTRWFHLRCGAEQRAERVGPALEAFDGELADEDRAAIDAIVASGIANPELALVQKADRAPTGRARCRECRELIEKGTWRVVLEQPEDAGAMFPNYFVHARCAPARVGATGLLDKLRRTTSDLDADDLAELSREITG